MQDKTFELVEKLYNRMEEGFKEICSEMATKADLARIQTELKQDMARMEYKFDNKIDIFLDAVRGNTEAINSTRADMQKLEAKVDAHEIKLKIVK